MIDEICRHVKNYFFDRPIKGRFNITNGVLAGEGLEGNYRYYYINGSSLNDGVHRVPATDLSDETFTGEIVPMYPPVGFLKLVSDIEEYIRNRGPEDEKYKRESFAGYSYTLNDAMLATWEKKFKHRLDMWRKI